MNSRKDIFLIILAALLLVAGSVVYLTPGLVAPVVPDEEGKNAAIKLLKEAAPRGESYPATPRASLEDNVQDWPTPEENDDNQTTLNAKVNQKNNRLTISEIKNALLR
jgi:hypothetical protein